MNVGTIGLVAGVIAGGAALAVLLLLREKMLAGLLAVLAALFLTLSFYSDQQASREAGLANFRAAEAEFKADWSAATGQPVKRQEALQKRADELAGEASEAEASRKETLTKNERSRKPLADVMEREINKTAVQLEAAGQPKTNFEGFQK